jgi:predicted nucleotidyltransferase
LADLFKSIPAFIRFIECLANHLVTLKPPKERPPLGLNWFGIWEKIEQILGRKVDLVTEESLSPYVRPYVEKERVVLYDEG